ncbi:2790_t:CDS:2, partial [Scutellospora calospora]
MRLLTTESIKDKTNYLKVELLDIENDQNENMGFIRKLRKRKQQESEFDEPNKRGKTHEVIVLENDEAMNIAEKTKGTTMYIPLTEVVEDLDILKTVDNDTSNVDVRVRLIQRREDRTIKNEIVPTCPTSINGELVDTPIDPGSRLNLMHEKYTRKRGLAWKCVNEGVVTNQGFYVMESASFDVLLGMPWIASANLTAVRRFYVREEEIYTLERGIKWSKKRAERNGLRDSKTIRHNEGVTMEPMVLRRLTIENATLLNFGTGLRPKEKKKIITRLVQEVSKVFAFDLSELGRTKLVEYEVRTGGVEVLLKRMRPIRINNSERAKLFEEHLREMIKYGLLEERNGPYAYHCFPIDKKEGGTDRIRAVGNMKPLNKFIVKDSYPLPIIQDILEKAVEHDWYSGVDAYKGYWQIGIREEDRDKVAVSMSMGVLRYTVMCMGLKNASETFQRLMDLILKGDEWRNCTAAYQDNVGLWTDGDLDGHIDVFIRLVKKFEEAELTFVAKKCFITYKEINMYGFPVSKNGIKVDVKGVKRIQEWRGPKNLDEPLTDLMRKDNACDISVRAVLEKVDKSSEFRPITFESRKLNSQEINYTVTEKECLAIVFGCNKNE